MHISVTDIRILMSEGCDINLPYFFESLYGIELTGLDMKGNVIFKTGEDRTLFELKFLGNAMRPFLHYGQVYEFDVICILSSGEVHALQDGRFVSANVNT